MCGIMGFITANPSEYNFHILGRLLMASDSRGKDATGICYFDNAKDGFFIEKNNVEAEQFIKDMYLKRKKNIANTHVVIGHTRAWTTGRPENNDNNHPIFSPHYVLVHNGTCVRTPKVEGYKYVGEVDSELIVAQIETKGIKTGLEWCTGSAALAFIDRRREKELLLYRETNPIWLAYKPGEETVFFASTDDIIVASLDEMLKDFFHAYHFRKLPENELWKVRVLKNGKLSIKMIGEYEYEKHKPTYNTQTKYTGQCASGGQYGMYDGCEEGYEGAGNVTAGRPTGTTKPEAIKDEREDVMLTASRWEWTKYWDLDTKAMKRISQFNWQWWPEYNVWFHRTERRIKRYIVENRRCEIASPETAKSVKWIKGLPGAYREKK